MVEVLGDEKMARMRRVRRIRIVLYSLIISFILYFFYRIKNSSTSGTKLNSPAPPPVLQYEKNPVYEYSSKYRELADHSFEASLDIKLSQLESSIRSTLPRNAQHLLAEKMIWQRATEEEASLYEPWIAQWRDNNLEWTYKLYTTPPTNIFHLFTGIPEIASAYKDYPEIREDLLRYILLWYHGGFYADLDTWARVGMRDCQPIVSVVQEQRNVSLMIGIDRDEPFLTQDSIKELGWTRGFGFGQAVIWAPRRFDWILRRAIVYTVTHARAHEKHGLWVRENGTYVEELSGPGMFTDVVLEILSESLETHHYLRDLDAGLEKRVTWKEFSKLKYPAYIEKDQIKGNYRERMRGLGVLPINIWGNGQGHSGSASSEHESACVNHVPGKRPRSK
jgi:alpha 1,6-mannosyltransferase